MCFLIFVEVLPRDVLPAGFLCLLLRLALLPRGRAQDDVFMTLQNQQKKILVATDVVTWSCLRIREKTRRDYSSLLIRGCTSIPSKPFISCTITRYV